MDYSKDMAPHAVTQVLTVELIDAGGPSTLRAELRYSSRDPYAVTIMFSIGQIELGWTFGRDLLFNGLYEPTGQGDVHLRPCRDSQGHAVVIIELRSLGGAALVQARAGDLHRFADQMTTLVRPGAESQHMRIDAAVTAILAANPIE